jgi:hypothetical protein
MKIGIFGDSFADCSWYPWAETDTNIGPGWPELLATNYNLVNYAHGGSSLFYSYQLFLKHHSQFDKVIFVTTACERFYTNLVETKTIFHVVPGTDFKKRSQVEKDRGHHINAKIVEAAGDYVLYVLDSKKERLFSDLMIDNITCIRPDTIIIPALHAKESSTVTVGEISKLENTFYNMTDQLFKLHNLTDLRKCHLTDENNTMVYEKIKDILTGKSNHFNLTNEDFRIPLKPLQSYWGISKL